LSHAEGEDTWEQFESAVEDAGAGLSEARDHYSAIRDLGGNLDAAYAEALDELEETVEEFDSVFDVGEGDLEEAVEAARQGELLSELTLAYRRYYEHLVESRAELVSEQFEALDSIRKESPDTNTDAGNLEKQVSVMNKLLKGGKHRQLLTSDRIYLDDIEESVRDIDEELREPAPPEYYAHYAVRLIETLRGEYTDHLSWLNERGADGSAISVSERIQKIPDIDEIETDDPATSSVTREEAVRAGEAAAAHYELAEAISDRRGQFELGESLCEVVSEYAELDDETEAELRQLTRAFDMAELRTRIARIIQTEATTSTSERVLRLLRQHDGSVRETATTLDISTEELFEVLQQLYEERTAADLEVQFE
jgi:hypothetical protein